MNSSVELEQIQLLKQTLQSVIYQKQAFELEFSETESSLEEIQNSSGDIYKIVGQLMIKSDHAKIKEELIEKQKIINLNLKKLADQEHSILEKIEKLRGKILK